MEVFFVADGPDAVRRVATERKDALAEQPQHDQEKEQELGSAGREAAEED
jgi:hypothetical protein